MLNIYIISTHTHTHTHTHAHTHGDVTTFSGTCIYNICIHRVRERDSD